MNLTVSRVRSQEYKLRHNAARRISREQLKDHSVPEYGKGKSDRVDLGLALLSIASVPGTSYSAREIAAWCGCSQSAIECIEKRALRKMTLKLFELISAADLREHIKMFRN